MAAAAAGHEWQRPFDPFGSEAVDIITQLTPSKTTQLSPAQQSAAAASPAHTADEAEDGADHDSDAFMDRLNASALQPQSLALSTSVAAPASIAAPQRQRGSRATIYEDDEEAHCSSQEDSALPPPPPPRMPRFPPTPSTASPASASVPSLLRPLQRQQQRTPVTGQRSHAWTQHADDADAVLLTKKAVARPVRSGREPSTLREGERSAHLPAALASPAGGGGERCGWDGVRLHERQWKARSGQRCGFGSRRADDEGGGGGGGEPGRARPARERRQGMRTRRCAPSDPPTATPTRCAPKRRRPPRSRQR